MPIRWRLALLVGAVTALLFTGAGLLFVRELTAGLQHDLNSTLSARATELVGQIGDQGTNFQDPGRGALISGSDLYQQVLRSDGTVLDSSDGLTGPLIFATQAQAAERALLIVDTTITPATGGPQHVRVLATGTARPGLVVAVATSRAVVDEAVSRSGWQLLLLGLILSPLAGAGAWLLAGAALRPVERMRAQAAALPPGAAAAGLAVPGTRDELARLAITLNDLLTRLHAAVDRERAFVADAGHELRTPLTVLRGELELGRRPGRTTEQLRATITVATDETDRLIRLAEDLLDLSRDDPAPPTRTHPFDLGAAARAAAAASRAHARARGVTLHTPQHPGPVVDGDPARIRQALDNLLTNAIRVSPPGGVVTVTVQPGNGWVTVQVGDQGPGFPQDFLPVAFDRFTRADPARSRARTGEPRGAGLGLAIVRSIMRGHHGTASAANNTGDHPGATVTLRWPTTPRPPAPPDGVDLIVDSSS